MNDVNNIFVAAAAAIWLFTAVLFGLLGFWGEMLWFVNLEVRRA